MKTKVRKLRKEDINKINAMLVESLEAYRSTISYMACDAPISVLCLPKVIENALLNHGCLRIYDLFNRDFTEVKGIGKTRIRELTSRLDQFLLMS